MKKNPSIHYLLFTQAQPLFKLGKVIKVQESIGSQSYDVNIFTPNLVKEFKRVM
jgi:hypothetical protein